MKSFAPIVFFLTAILSLTLTAAAYTKATCTDPKLCCIIEVIDEGCHDNRIPTDFSWAYQRDANDHCISNITSLGAALAATCSPGINWIKIYNEPNCLGPPAGVLPKPGSACYYPDGWFIRSFAVMSSLIS